MSINSDKSHWDINIWNQSSRKSGICLACFWCGNFSWKLLSRILSYFLLRSLGKKRISLDVPLSSAVRGSDKPLVFYLLSAWFLLNDKVVFCLTFKVSLIYECKASERPLQIKYLLVFLVEEPASCLVLRTLAGAPDQTLFWEQYFDFPGFHFADKSISFPVRAYPPVFLFLSFCYVGPWFEFFSNSDVCHKTNVTSSAEMGTQQCLGYLSAGGLAQMDYHKAVCLACSS